MDNLIKCAIVKDSTMFINLIKERMYKNLVKSKQEIKKKIINKIT